MEITITATNANAIENIPVPEDVAKDLADVYEALSKLPVTRVANVDFETKEAVSLFMRQAKAWCATHKDAEGNAAPLTFTRKGDAKGNPLRLTFRVYVPMDMSDEAKAARKAEAEAKKLAKAKNEAQA